MDRFVELAKMVPPRKASWDDVCGWVFEHALDPPDMLDPAEIPSRGAVGLLRHVQASSEHYAEFIRGYQVKPRSTGKQASSQPEQDASADAIESALLEFEREMAREGVLDAQGTKAKMGRRGATDRTAEDQASGDPVEE